MKPVQLNLRHLITFYFVAHEKSFSAAAEKLFLTEPAVSRQISCLERDCKVKLLNVNRKRVYVTKVGEELFQHAEEIYKEAKSAEKLLVNSQGRSLHVGVSTTLAPVVAEAGSQFERLFTGVKLVIRNGPSYQIVEELLDLQHDIAIVVSRAYKNPKLKTIRVANGQRLVLVVSPSDPILLKNQLKLADVCGYPLFTPREGSATRAILLEKFAAEGLDIKDSISVEVDYLECTKRFAEAGDGIALMPETEVREDVAEGKLKILPLLDELNVGVDILMLRDVSLPQIAEKFISFTKSTFKKQCYC